MTVCNSFPGHVEMGKHPMQYSHQEGDKGLDCGYEVEYD